MYGMFSKEGGRRVGEIVDRHIAAARSAEYGFDLDRVYDRAMADVLTLAEGDGFREAGDTAVREEVWSALVHALTPKGDESIV